MSTSTPYGSGQGNGTDDGQCVEQVLPEAPAGARQYNLQQLVEDHTRNRSRLTTLIEKIRHKSGNGMAYVRELGKEEDEKLAEVGINWERVPALIRRSETARKYYVRIHNAIYGPPEEQLKNQGGDVKTRVADLQKIDDDIDYKLYGPKSSSLQPQLQGLEGELYSLGERRKDHLDALDGLEGEVNSCYQRIQNLKGFLSTCAAEEERKKAQIYLVQFNRSLSGYKRDKRDIERGLLEMHHRIEQVKSEKKELQVVQGYVQVLIDKTEGTIQDNNSVTSNHGYTKLLAEIVPDLQDSINRYIQSGQVVREHNHEQRRRLAELTKQELQQPQGNIQYGDPLEDGLKTREEQNEQLRTLVDGIRKDPFGDIFDV